jgi:hypothetical protein
MADTEFEFSDEALRAASSAARAARGNTRGNTRGGHSDTHRKRPRQDDERRCAGTARRRIAPQTDETMRRLFGALRDSTAKPICEGGLAHYFISEAHRRADMIMHPRPRAASSLSIPSVFDAFAAASRKEGSPVRGDCPVCMEDASCDSIALSCGHAFHKRCIMVWLQMNSSCPCCRAPVPPSEPYRYPARTKLLNPLLRARVEGVGLDMCEVALRTLHIEGMQGVAGLVCMRSPATDLAPVLDTRDAQ